MECSMLPGFASLNRTFYITPKQILAIWLEDCPSRDSKQKYHCTLSHSPCFFVPSEKYQCTPGTLPACNGTFRMERKSWVKTSLRARVFGNAAQVLLQEGIVKLLALGFYSWNCLFYVFCHPFCHNNLTTRLLNHNMVSAWELCYTRQFVIIII